MKKISDQSDRSDEFGLDEAIASLRRCLVLSADIEHRANRGKQDSNSGKCIRPNCQDFNQKKTMAEAESQTEMSNIRSKSIEIIEYRDETQLDDIMRLIAELSEPYSVYTYRYFLHNWSRLCLLAMDTSKQKFVGAIVCKLDESLHTQQGYIAMLAVNESYRKMGIGTRLVERAIENMVEMGCDEVVLEAAVSNAEALRLYGNLGFIRVERLFRYYLDGVDAYRLKLFLPDQSKS